ncbi:MAG: winged helix-turn-helix domain-containing protein [Desulfobacterales bacterium]
MLTAREFSILEFLLYNKGRAVSRFSLAELVWGDAFDPFSMSNFMDVHIKNLRKKIGDSGLGTLIRTIRGAGYIIKDLEEEIWDIFIGVISALAISVLVLAAISYLLAGFILKPVRIINDQTHNISEKDLERRIPVSGNHDEFNIEGVAREDRVDVARTLESLIADYRFLAEPRNIDIEARLPKQLIVKGNAKKLNRAFLKYTR